MEKKDNQFLNNKWEDHVFQCPSCDIKLKSDEVRSHCEVEVNSLIDPRISEVKNILLTNNEYNNNNVTKSEVKSWPWGIFQKVKKNRLSRSEIRIRKRSPTDAKCPIRSIQVTRDINRQIEKCLKSSNDQIDEHNSYSNIDEFEEYEWAGQTRIRVASLLQGGYASIGVGTNISIKNSEEDEDLNVDEDDTTIYGPPQYNISDVITTETVKNGNVKECDINNYLQTSAILSEVISKDIDSFEQDNTEQNSSKSAQQIIDSLKSKLRQCEKNTQNKLKCLICLDEYNNPAISISCWHVHCEECWLKSLGTRKLCPQCNLITSPSDLRRIYM